MFVTLVMGKVGILMMKSMARLVKLAVSTTKGGGY